MHLALILDDERLLHEKLMLSRLCVGLMDEGCTLTRLVPIEPTGRGERYDEGPAGVTTRLAVPLKVLPWMRSTRAEQIAQAMERSAPDAIYAVGRDTWQLAGDLGRRFESPVAISVWSADLLPHIPRGRSAAAIGAYVAPTRPLADALRDVVDPNLVSYVPQGVAVPKSAWPVFQDSSRPIALAVVGSGRDVMSYRALLGGFSRLLRDNYTAHAFIELRGPQQHEIWRHAHRLDLLSNVSTITDAARFRSLLTQCDALVLPERYGEVRSLVLDAMAMGLPIVAAEDPFLDMLIADETALLVSQPETDAWAAQLRKLLSSPEFAQKLGLAGRAYIDEHHRSSRQIAALLEMLNRLIHGEAIDYSAAVQ